MLRAEFHIPISPTPDFLIRLHYIAASIAFFSGLPTGTYKIVVTVGDADRVDLDELCPWARHYPIEWRWLLKEECAEHGMYATAYRRFRYEIEAETCVMLDSDTLVTGPLVEAIAAAACDLGFFAVPAPYCPFYCDPACLEIRSPHQWWNEIYRVAGLQPPPFAMEHPAWPWLSKETSPHIAETRFSPPYPNSGVIIGSAETMRRIGSCIYQELDTVLGLFRHAVSGQIALSLAISRQGLAWRALPLRFNYFNVQLFYDAHPEEASDIRVIHYLQATEVDRVADFGSYDRVERLFTRRGLGPLNAFLVARLRELHETRVLRELQSLPVLSS